MLTPAAVSSCQWFGTEPSLFARFPLSWGVWDAARPRSTQYYCAPRKTHTLLRTDLTPPPLTHASFPRAPRVTVETKSNQFIQKKNRLAVYSYLFKEGVLVAKKDFFKAKHDEIEDVPNLEVLALMKSMKSRGLVRETFNW